jgi:hypothetical protein
LLTWAKDLRPSLTLWSFFTSYGRVSDAPQEPSPTHLVRARIGVLRVSLFWQHPKIPNGIAAFLFAVEQRLSLREVSLRILLHAEDRPRVLELLILHILQLARDPRDLSGELVDLRLGC